jgi:hypothetical protein
LTGRGGLDAAGVAPGFSDFEHETTSKAAKASAGDWSQSFIAWEDRTAGARCAIIRLMQINDCSKLTH